MSEPITPTEKTADELKAEIAKLESDKQGLVGETQDLRKSRQEKDEEIATLKAALVAAAEKNQANPEEQKIAEVVARVLSKEKEQSAVTNREAAFTKFVAENKEYHPDNDPGGLKLSALKKEFEGFNTTGLVATEDFVAVIGKANALLRGTDTSRQTPTDTNPYSSTTSTPAAPVVKTESKLSPEEQKLVADNGWTEDQFLKLKAKMPDMIDDLIRPVVH